jgi:hypothetical protein
MIPDKLPTTESEVIKYAPRAVVHLRAQHKRKRLGLIFGAGLSIGLEYPDWKTLVSRIASDNTVRAEGLLRKFLDGDATNRKATEKNQAVLPTRSLASITHMLFSYYRDVFIASKRASGEWNGSLSFLQEQLIRSEWLRLIHQKLYEGTSPTSCRDRLSKHPYLSGFLKIIQQSPMTVNYNFDDSLERLLHYNRDEAEKQKERGYEITVRPNAQFQRDSRVIYHPNGFLPSIFEDGASPEVVFSDDSFQDELINAASGRYIHLSNFIQRNTCLLIGTSLEDTTLQSLLRQNAISNGGNVHYVVHYTPNDIDIDVEAFKAIFESNFAIYNAYTLFLGDQGIKALADAIGMGDSHILDVEKSSKKKYVYYIIGSIGAGKTTMTNNFRNLITYDEWIEERRAELAQPEKTIDPNVIGELDNWIASQFEMKNRSLQHFDEGIHLVDRCPLDPLTFGERENRSKKAGRLLEQVTDKGQRHIEPGHIIYLDSDISELKRRNSFKHKYWTDAQLSELLGGISEVYQGLAKSTILTHGRDIQDVVREVSRVIFLDDYNPVDVQAELEKHAKL